MKEKLVALKIETTERPWQALSPDEKMEKRFAAWLSPPGLTFATPEAEKAYKERVSRFTAAINLRKPDRVPVSPSLGSFAAEYCGYSDLDLMTDPEKGIEVALKCTLDFQADAAVGAGGYPARSLELLDWKLFDWPGHGVGVNDGYQFKEGEYMKADEYEAFIEDPTDYWWRTYLPRIVGALEPLSKVAAPTYFNAATTIPANLSRYGLPEVKAALEKLVKAGEAALAWQQKVGPLGRRLNELGFPSTMGAPSEAPFDIMGDALRGTRGIMMDIFRQPENLLRALEKVTPMMIKMAVSGARLGSSPVVMIPMHKGADGFMSDEQFRTFYWPSLREVCLGLIQEGLVPQLFAEGGYNTRLEAVCDLPMGKSIWYFDYTDMARAKEVLGDMACIQGNVPVAMMHAGTPADVDAYCRKLIATAGKDDGFILSTGAGIGRGTKVENVRAMINSVKKYGTY